MDIDDIIRKAVAGNRTALEAVVVNVQDDIYYLALRMLSDPDDARDATQEILIQVITKLSTFQYRSRFSTWVYRVAVNYLLTEKKILAKDMGLSFDMFKSALESDLQEPSRYRDEPDYPVLLNELRIYCTMAMLLCLNSPLRMAYILSDIYEMDQAEASEILGISKDNFRKQVSRAREKVIQFTSTSCGIVNADNACHCSRKLTGAVNCGRVHPEKIRFVTSGVESYEDVKNKVNETKQELKTLELQKAVYRYKSPVELGEIIESLVKQGIKADKPVH